MNFDECETCGFSTDTLFFNENNQLQCASCYIYELKQKIEELEAQNAYECECNKELVATQKENEDLRKELKYCQDNGTKYFTIWNNLKNYIKSEIEINEGCANDSKNNKSYFDEAMFSTYVESELDILSKMFDLEVS